MPRRDSSKEPRKLEGSLSLVLLLQRYKQLLLFCRFQISEVSALSNRFALLCPPPFLLSIVVQECQGMGQKKTLLALLMAH